MNGLLTQCKRLGNDLDGRPEKGSGTKCNRVGGAVQSRRCDIAQDGEDEVVAPGIKSHCYPCKKEGQTTLNGVLQATGIRWLRDSVQSSIRDEPHSGRRRRGCCNRIGDHEDSNERERVQCAVQSRRHGGGLTELSRAQLQCPVGCQDPLRYRQA
jgi:hypothetical protein